MQCQVREGICQSTSEGGGIKVLNYLNISTFEILHEWSFYKFRRTQYFIVSQFIISRTRKRTCRSWSQRCPKRTFAKPLSRSSSSTSRTTTRWRSSSPSKSCFPISALAAGWSSPSWSSWPWTTSRRTARCRALSSQTSIRRSSLSATSAKVDNTLSFRYLTCL